jgi:cell shape-determining protein MreC
MHGGNGKRQQALLRRRAYIQCGGSIMDLVGIFSSTTAVVSLFIVLPALVLNFVHRTVKNKRETEVEKIRLQKEILELEIEKENVHIKALEVENKKLDKMIEHKAVEESNA